MSEKFPSTNQLEFNSEEQEIWLEESGYIGKARFVQYDQDSFGWQIIISAGNRVICTFDCIGDAENAKNEIVTTINQFLWDPMSQA